MHSLVNEILQRIIHKTVTCNAGLAGKERRSYPNPEMGAETAPVGTGMTRMGATLVNDFERACLQGVLQALCHLAGEAGLVVKHQLEEVSDLMWRAM
jgi:hypothetical protein